MKKVLIVATVVKTHINAFHLPYIKMFKEHGYQTYVAAKNDYADEKPVIPNCDCYYMIPFARNPFSPKNIKAYAQLKKLIDDVHFDIVQCNTPVGGVLGRLAARKARKKGTKVVYMAHGFHFFKGGSKLAWLVFYPIEKALSRITDVLITINREDYALAEKKFHAKQTAFIHGVGVDLEKINRCQPDAAQLRASINVPEKAPLLISVGELRKLKNHENIMHAMTKLQNSAVHYVIAGCGSYEETLKQTIQKLGLQDRVHLLGFRKDVYDLLKVSDIFCFPSTREGMPVALTEAMEAGLPVVASSVRGNRDLIVPDKGGYLYKAHDVNGFAEGIQKLLADADLRRQMGQFNKNHVKEYDLEIVKEQLSRIYFSDEAEDGKGK